MTKQYQVHICGEPRGEWRWFSTAVEAELCAIELALLVSDDVALYGGEYEDSWGACKSGELGLDGDVRGYPIIIAKVAS